MKTSDFEYILPAEKIAQMPMEPRDSSRLIVLDRRDKRVSHTIFKDIGSYLSSGDLLVLNTTRVIPARLTAIKTKTGGRFEVLLIRQEAEDVWEVMVGGKRIKSGLGFTVVGGPSGNILKELDGARRFVHFDKPINSFIHEAGQVPLPPYIHEKIEDPERYQTVYSQITGSVAAPTAGLHFTDKLMVDLGSMGINFAKVTLHIGLDTFAPVSEEDPRDHKIHTEWCDIPAETANLVNKTHKEGGRIIAVGTTSVRALESCYYVSKSGDLIKPYTGPTDLFILPGYTFKVVDAMITNFHLPRSTLLMMVSAFVGRDVLLASYQEALENGYRFYSFGDAMFIL